MGILKKDKKNGLYHKFWLYVLIALLPFIILTGIIINGFRIGNGYTQFTTDLYQSIKDGIAEDSLRVEYKGESTRLTEKNAFSVASFISSSRFKIFRKNYQATDEMYFDFGNGDRMWLYPYDSTTIIIKYIYDDGETKTYITKEIKRMVTVERLVSTEWGNGLWDE